MLTKRIKMLNKREKDLLELVDENGNLKLDILHSDYDAYYEKLKQKPKSEPDTILSRYRVFIEDSVVWGYRKNYIDLIESFLSKEIDGEIFSEKFFELRGQTLIEIRQLYEKIEEDIKPIPNVFYTSKSDNFNSAICDLFFTVDDYDPEYNPDIEDSDEDSDLNDFVSSERKLRAVIQKVYLPILKKSCDLEDSFFPSSYDSKIGVDQLIQRSYNLLFLVLVFVLSLGVSGFFNLLKHI